MINVSIEPLPQARTKEGAAVLARSFHEAAWTRHVFPDPARRRRALPPFFEAVLADGVRHGCVWGAFASGRLLGAAVWLPPGRYPWGTARKLRAQPRMLRALAAAPRSASAFSSLGQRIEAAFPTDGAYWYLQVVGVDEGAKGAGVGTALLEPGLRRADDDRTACYLETDSERNVRWYRRLGFRVEGDGLPFAGPGGPSYWTMIRPPEEGE
jgi:ribosomal protein S18 acetylase RimI-like enzyme